ncbi:Dynein heavy chain 14, axonemal [Frankliniella fusca]|uniref:Dynein heavy chain 14, axonemal n=1 Tax=Frankliniella fusca TaxID=407009 RepID=A0AAE1HCP5_9NEOP|nr:Dynein heavy chain 14, axonemal [Frankliniella fusca]
MANGHGPRMAMDRFTMASRMAMVIEQGAMPGGLLLAGWWVPLPGRRGVPGCAACPRCPPPRCLASGAVPGSSAGTQRSAASSQTERRKSWSLGSARGSSPTGHTVTLWAGRGLGDHRRDAEVAYLPGRAPRARRSTIALDARTSVVVGVDCARAGGVPGFMLSACLRLLAALDEVVGLLSARTSSASSVRRPRTAPGFRATALFLDPSDQVAAGFRARQLRQAIRERDPLARRLRTVLTSDPGKSWVKLPAWGATGRRVSPVFLLASLADPSGQWAYDAIVGRLPLVCEEPLVPMPSPVVPGIVPLLRLNPGASLEDGALGLTAPDVGLRPAPSPRVRAMINLATWNVRGAAQAGAKEAIDAALLGRAKVTMSITMATACHGHCPWAKWPWYYAHGQTMTRPWAGHGHGQNSP